MRRKNNDYSYIYDKARRYCAYQERCVFDLKGKLYEWKVRPEVANKIINTLEEENYLNEERYARVFAGGKFRIKKWGRNKIMAELRARKIPESIIQLGLDEIDEQEYARTLNTILEKKKSELELKNRAEIRQKLYRFAMSKGYESPLILEALKP